METYRTVHWRNFAAEATGLTHFIDVMCWEWVALEDWRLAYAGAVQLL